MATHGGKPASHRRKKRRTKLERWLVGLFGVVLAGAFILELLVYSEDVDMPPVAYAIIGGLMALIGWYEIMQLFRD